MSNESFKSSMNLQKAIEEANRMTVMQPTPQPSPNTNETRAVYSGCSALQLLNSMKEEEENQQDSDDDIPFPMTTPFPPGDHSIQKENSILRELSFL